MLAKRFKEIVKTKEVWFGAPNEKAAEADIIFAGFWTDKGTAYFDQIMERVKQNLSSSNEIIGTYMCQGKMPMGIRARYEKMLREHPEDMKFKGMIENFDKAISHPDEEDLRKLQEAVEMSIE